MANIQFPGDTVWAFNPNYIVISDANEYVRARVSVDKYEITVVVFKGGARVNVSRLMQLCFTNPSVSRSKVIRLSVDFDGEAYEKEVTVIWGSVNLGERYAIFGCYAVDADDKGWWEKRIHYFVNFPATLDIMLFKNYDIRIRKDNEGYAPMEGASTEYDSELKNYELGKDIPVGKRETVIRQDIPEEIHSTFCHTFDYTFFPPGASSAITKIIPRHEKEGYYLRWVDGFGCVMYYLFTSGELSISTENKGGTLSTDEARGGMYFSGLARSVEIGGDRTIKLCAVNLEEDTIRQIESILTSPIIDLYGGTTKDGEYIWLPVCVEEGRYTYATRRKPLQDFELTIKLPKKASQTL